MNFETVLILLVVVSALTGLITEALKKLFEDANKSYSANLMAGIVAVVLAVAVGIGYSMINEIAIDQLYVLYMIALAVLSWLESMLGFDKVNQVIKQVMSLKDSNEESGEEGELNE